MEKKFTLTDNPLKNNGKILVIEDDSEILRYIEIILQREGLEYISACNAAQALSEFGLKDNNISAVLTDVVLPDISGIGIAREVHDKYPDMPFLFCTSVEDPSTSNLLWQHGMVYRKPLQEDFAAAVRRLVMCSNSQTGVFGIRCEKDKDRRHRQRRETDVKV